METIAAFVVDSTTLHILVLSAIAVALGAAFQQWVNEQ